MPTAWARLNPATRCASAYVFACGCSCACLYVCAFAFSFLSACSCLSRFVFVFCLFTCVCLRWYARAFYILTCIFVTKVYVRLCKCTCSCVQQRDYFRYMIIQTWDLWVHSQNLYSCTCMHTWIRTNINTRKHIQIRTCMNTYAQKSVHTYTYAFPHSLSFSLTHIRTNMRHDDSNPHTHRHFM